MSRNLTPGLFNAFQSGDLSPLLQEVQKDSTLCLEFRGDSANVYYRGGSLFKIKRKGNQYGLSFNLKYNTKEDPDLVPKPDIQQGISLIPYYKRAMDYWFKNHEKLENETQQLILRENNFTKVSRDSDYYILDIEYKEEKDINNSPEECRNCRYDMVAIKWLSTSSVRQSRSATLSLMELKFGDGALTGKCGIIEHLNDFKSLFDDHKKIDELCDEMSKVYKQKHQLKLLCGLEGTTQKDGEIKISHEGIEVIFIFANHKPASRKLKKELEEFKKSDAYSSLQKNAVQVKFAVSSAMGYNLYASKMLDLEEFLKTL